MMTGYGYNSNLVQQPPGLQGVDGEWSQTNQSQYYSGSGSTGLPNPALFYGSMDGWYEPPPLIYHDPSNANSYLAPGNTPMFPAPPPGLAPPLSQPRVSISDEELYQALNLSPIPTTSTHNTTGFHNSLLQPHHPQTDFLASEVCYPSTSSYESSVYDQNFLAGTSALTPQEEPQQLQQYHHMDGDDENLYNEGERYGTMSPTFSINSFAPTTSTNTTEAEDLEVELINNAKAPPTYQGPSGIDAFLHTGTTDDTEYSDDDSRPTTTYSHRSTKAPSPPASRPAYAQKLTAAGANQPKCDTVNSEKTAPLFLQTTGPIPAGFTPLLTPNSDALLQKKLNEAGSHPLRHLGQTAFPVFPTNPQPSKYLDTQQYQENFLDFNSVSSDGFYPPTSLNPRYEPAYPADQDIFPLLLDTFKPLPQPQFTSIPVSAPVNIPERLTSTKKLPPSTTTAPIKAPRLSDQELECESQKLAIDVISNLFTSKKEIIDRAAVLDAPKKPVARNLFCHDQASKEKAKSDEPIKMNVLDDWETADDDDLTDRMENLLKDVKKEEKKKQTALPKPSFPVATTPKSSDWDKNYLPHVLEIYGVPDYKMQEDVVKAMETIGFGDCKVLWIERKVVFAVFENVGRAKNCLTLAKHDWLRFRSLADSPKTVQDSAKTNSSSFTVSKKKQQTTATVARRMVENALGKKAAVPAEKRQEERNQLAAARAAKKNTIQWD